MANVYGVTHTTIREEFFPGVSTFSTDTRPTAIVVARIIDRVSASIDSALLAVGIASADLDSVGEPVSYAFLADTLSLGVAARLAGVGALGAEAEAVVRWAEEFARRLRQIVDATEEVLPDAETAGATGAGVRSHVTDLALEDELRADVETDNAPSFTIWDEA